MKKFILASLIVFCSIVVSAQQEQRYSLYMFNKTLYNPATVGSNGYLNLNTGYRNQWQGIELAPSSKYISADMALPKLSKKLGVGVMINNSEIGLINNTNLNLAFAYRTRLDDSSWISIGGSAELKGSTFNANKMSIQDQNDVAFPQMNNTQFLPNYNLGVYYQSKNKFIGYSVYNLIAQSINYSQIERPITGTEKMYMNLSAGYFIDINNLFTFKQSVLVKADFDATAQFDITPSILYKGLYEIGLSYRYGESLVGIFQASILNQLKLGYAYDYGMGGLSNYQNGSHEIMLTYTFIKNKKIMVHPRMLNL